MFIFEKELSIPAAQDHRELISHSHQAFQFHLPDGAIPIRFVITESDRQSYKCEVGVATGLKDTGLTMPDSLFRFACRATENTSKFNAVLLVPTGIGAEIGGHAGDATPVARLLAEVCDTLITHPNVVNASDINEATENTLYVEGSVISRLLMGTVGLQPVRSNRVLVVIDKHPNNQFVNAALNAVSAARASFGLQCPKVVQLDPPVRMTAKFSESGRAVGEIENLDYLCQVLADDREQFDAVAISSVIQVPLSYHQDYFDLAGEMVNPWGGVEAMLTHTLSSIFNVPSAHSPMFENEEIANMDPGIVEPRMAAEAISLTFLECILKGLQRSPKIVTDQEAMYRPGVISAADVSCLVIPDGCLGLPTMAALEQSIPVIAVRENKNLMKNDLMALPWAPGQLNVVDNYLEAAGAMNAMRAGLAPESVRRPFAYTRTEVRSKSDESDVGAKSLKS